MHRQYYPEFLDKCFVVDCDNILQNKLCTCQLAAQSFSCPLPNLAIDMIDTKLTAIVDDMHIPGAEREDNTSRLGGGYLITYQFEEKLNSTMDKSGTFFQEL